MAHDAVDAGLDAPDAGRLEQRLLQVALEHLADRPAEQLSMRQVAQDLRVSHQAPYVHFGTKKAFLAAVAGAGLQAAADRARATVAAAGPDPVVRLHALADAYLAFIRDHPHVHDLAYGPAVAKSDHPLLQHAAIAYWNLLHDTVASCQPAGTSEAEVLRRSAVVWGLVYGIARLAAFRQIPASVASPPDELVHAALQWEYQAWRSRTPSDL
jgi:AcrR family transcriptional regulator